MFKADDERELPLDLNSLRALQMVKLLEEKPNHPGDVHLLASNERLSRSGFKHRHMGCEHHEMRSSPPELGRYDGWHGRRPIGTAYNPAMDKP